MEMPFGRYRGELLEDVPSDYIAWLLRQDWLRPTLRDALEWERDRRRGYHDRREQSHASAPPGAMPAMAAKIAKAGYRALAIENHPDRGGSTETMQQVNAAWEWFRRSFRGLL